MKNATIERQSLLTDAFETLLKGLGPQKTTQLWKILMPPRGDYLMTRQKLFSRKNVASISKATKKFNRK